MLTNDIMLNWILQGEYNNNTMPLKWGRINVRELGGWLASATTCWTKVCFFPPFLKFFQSFEWIFRTMMWHNEMVFVMIGLPLWFPSVCDKDLTRDLHLTIWWTKIRLWEKTPIVFFAGTSQTRDFKSKSHVACLLKIHSGLFFRWKFYPHLSDKKNSCMFARTVKVCFSSNYSTRWTH